MQLHMTQGALKRQAKLLAQFLQDEGTPIQHSRALEAIARCYGYRDWRTAIADLPADVPCEEPIAAPATVPEPKPQVRPELTLQFLELIDRKLAEVTHKADGTTLDAIRSLAKRVTPGLDCIPVSQLMDEINKLTAAGHLARRAAMRGVVQEMGSTYQLQDDALVAQVMQLAAKHYPPNLFISLIDNYPATYKRHHAPENKFQERAFTLKRSAVEVGSLNNRSRALAEIETDVKQWRLSTAARQPAPAIRVLYTTRAKGASLENPARQSFAEFPTVAAALAAPLPPEADGAMFSTAEGAYAYSGVFGWQLNGVPLSKPAA